MDRVLGLDSGGTKTILAIAEKDGSVPIIAGDGGLDPVADPRWPERLTALVLQVGRFDAAVFGLPCHGENDAIDEAQRNVVDRIAGPGALVENDVRIAFDGAFAGGPGILLLAGTGSMAWGSDGETHLRVGGWGTAFGDEGSAHWIGREAVSLALRALDGRGGSGALADALLGIDPALPTAAIFDRLALAAAGRSTVAALSRTVDVLAEAGDEDATDILVRAAVRLAEHVHAARRRLAGEGLPWSHAGGAFTSRILLRETCRTVGDAPRRPVLPPVGGAILRAANLAGWTVDAAFVSRLQDELARSKAS